MSEQAGDWSELKERFQRNHMLFITIMKLARGDAAGVMNQRLMLAWKSIMKFFDSIHKQPFHRDFYRGMCSDMKKFEKVLGNARAIISDKQKRKYPSLLNKLYTNMAKDHKIFIDDVMHRITKYDTSMDPMRLNLSMLSGILLKAGVWTKRTPVALSDLNESMHLYRTADEMVKAFPSIQFNLSKFNITDRVDMQKEISRVLQKILSRIQDDEESLNKIQSQFLQPIWRLLHIWDSKTRKTALSNKLPLSSVVNILILLLRTMGVLMSILWKRESCGAQEGCSLNDDYDAAIHMIEKGIRNQLGSVQRDIQHRHGASHSLKTSKLRTLLIQRSGALQSKSNTKKTREDDDPSAKPFSQEEWNILVRSLMQKQDQAQNKQQQLARSTARAPSSVRKQQQEQQRRQEQEQQHHLMPDMPTFQQSQHDIQKILSVQSRCRYKHNNQYEISRSQVLQRRKNQNIRDVEDSMLLNKVGTTIMRHARSGGFSSIMLVDVRNMSHTMQGDFQSRFQKLYAQRSTLRTQDCAADDMEKPLYVFIDQGLLDHSMQANIQMETLDDQSIRIRVSCAKTITGNLKKNCMQHVESVDTYQADTTNPMDDYVLLSLRCILEKLNERVLSADDKRKSLEMSNLRILDQFLRKHRYNQVSDAVMDKRRQLLRNIRQSSRAKVVPVFVISKDKHRDWVMA